MDIHIKPVEKFQLVERKILRIKDIAEVYSLEYTVKQHIENLTVFQVPENKDKTYLISIMDIISVIQKAYPKGTISNLGETDTIVEYHVIGKKENKFFTWSKVFAVSAILFAGATTTLMCFQSDGQLPLIFENYYRIFTGIEEELPTIFTIPYSLGLFFGVTLFFNHFGKIKVTDDPTPIEIEMTTYEKDNNASVIDYLNQQEKGE